MTNRSLKGLILDVAGTFIDFGSMAPTDALLNSFSKFGLKLTNEEVRYGMGLLKIDHTNAIFSQQSVIKKWLKVYKRPVEAKDIQDVYAQIEIELKSIVKNYCEPINGIYELKEYAKNNNIKIGTTTGYTQEMMDIIIPELTEKNLIMDTMVNPSMVQAGRPHPWMIYENMKNMGIYPTYDMIKIGDTFADIDEGRNAGMWVIALTTGNELGITFEKYLKLEEPLLNKKNKDIKNKFLEYGAHYVCDGIWDVIPTIQLIKNKISNNEYPF